MLLLALALTLGGFAALALALDRHHRQVLQRAPSELLRHGLRVLGSVCLGAAFAVCTAYSGWSIGAVLWSGMLTVAGVVVALLFTFVGYGKR